MACASGSVEKAANRTVAAKSQIDKLDDMLKAKDAANKSRFSAEIASHLADAKVTDARELDYNSHIKTEYTSQFSLDKIAAIVTSALKAAAQDPTAPQPAMSPAAIEAYTDVVNTVAEAAKSSSTAAASLAFSMTRLSPGMFAFLYASSVNITDEDTFGTEGVTSTAIYYRLMQSIDDVRNQSKFGAAIIDTKNLLNMKTVQAALTDELAEGTIDIDLWMDKDAKYSHAIERIQERLDAASFDTARSFAVSASAGFGAPVEHSFSAGSTANQELIRAAIQRLSAKGAAYAAAVETSRARLASTYY